MRPTCAPVVLLALLLAGIAASPAIRPAAAFLGHRAACVPTAAALAGCPELLIQADDAGFTLPTQVDAGLTLVTFENGTANEVEPEIARLPAGVTVADLQAQLVGNEGAPAWLYETVFVGGPGTIPPGGRSRAVVDLTPGDYAVFSVEDVAAAATLTVVPTADAATREPAATAATIPTIPTITLAEMAFDVPAAPAAGPQVWQVVNTGQQPHQLVLITVPDDTTLEQVQQLLTADPSAPPDPSLPDPSTLLTVGGLAFLSAGQTAWAVLDLAPGTYVALCWIPDQASGIPHAYMGMIAIVTVAA
jgi:hypothetical protein